jgi:YVTN family beta-propeller protein
MIYFGSTRSSHGSPVVTPGRSVLLAGFAVAFVVGCGSDKSSGASSSTPGAVTGHVYVSMTGDNEIIVIDPATRAITGHIPVGVNPAILLATPDYEKLYTANWGDNTMSAVDVATQKVTSIALDSRPWVQAMSPDGKSVYVGLGSNEIAVIDTATDLIARNITFPTLPGSIIVSPDGKTLYVANVTGNTLEAVSSDTGDVIHPSLGVGVSPAWITISVDGASVYTLNFLSGDVTVVDTASWTVSATVKGPIDPDGGGTSAGIIGNVTPNGSILGVTDYGTQDVSAIDTKTNATAWTLPTVGRPIGIGFSPDSSRGYVGDQGPSSIAVTPSILVAALISGTVLEPTGDGLVTVFDAKTGAKLGDSIPVGKGPSSIVVTPN